MKDLENVGAVDGAQLEDSVPPQSFILSMRSIDSCSRDDRACEHCQSSTIDRLIVLSFELFVNLISPHATKVARPTNLRCRLNRYCFGCSSQSGEKGLGLLSSDGRATNSQRNAPSPLRSVSATC